MVTSPRYRALTAGAPWVTLRDPDLRAYVRAVEAADGARLELPVRKALHEFITGCKSDGIWSAIKASCILAGARTLAGALVPLVGTAPTNFNFVSGDYNRKTGLVGDGSTKYLDSNRANNADPQNSSSLAVHVTQVASPVKFYCGKGNTDGDATSFGVDATGLFLRSRSSTAGRTSPTAGSNAVGLMGMSRSTSSSFTARSNLINTSISVASVLPSSGSLRLFAASGDASALTPCDARIAFYSIGESLDLALLDARVTQLITTFAAVLP